ncbi:MAG: sulfatase [Verrucomicrobiae bacterium]|nr:sulfatase [Verrucomicrobiae bacterium]
MRISLSWLIAASLLAIVPVSRASDLPNVVLIVADDLGWADLGCYGSDLHETPRLDRFASEGIRFTDAYAASPVCTPTRASIMTGKHPARLHMTIWREAALERGKRELLEPVCLDSLPLEEHTLAEVFKENGYHTVHIGKWHLGRAESYPQPHGFHENIGGTLWGAPQTFFYPYNGDDYYPDWRYVPDLEPGEEGDYLTDALTDRALAILDREVKADRPLFLNLWYHTVHTPTEGKPELVAKYEAKLKARPGTIQKNPHYAAMVESLDQNVGRVLDRIEELGISGETIVVFTSDNGGFINTCKLHPGLQVANNSPLRSGKGSCYEGGVRIPLIVRAPKASAPSTGRTCDTPVWSCDLYPTLLGLAGLGEKDDNAVDGLDLAPLLADPDASLERDALFFHYPHYYPTTSPVSAVRQENWKLLEYLGLGGKVELFDLTNDLGETRNLADSQSEKREELLTRLHAWRAEVDASMPEPNPDFKPKKTKQP